MSGFCGGGYSAANNFDGILPIVLIVLFLLWSQNGNGCGCSGLFGGGDNTIFILLILFFVFFNNNVYGLSDGK